MAGSSSATSTEDIRKMGQLVKIKTNKKKYFVLRDETKSSSARLEYYDSEKKWRSGSAPKRTIVLKNCFNINAKPDARHRHAIALYTKDDCFAVSCQSEDEQQDWLTNMIELRNRNLDENSAARPLFEHIWPVTVKSRGLGGNERKVIPGQYRLCLTNKDLSLIRMNNDQSDIVLPLDCIRRCGHTHQFFFLELGRSAITGSGSLWLQVEDMVISQNIHEALLSSMKNNEVPTSGIFRVRSGSSAMENRKRASMAPAGGSSTLHPQPKRVSSMYTSNPSPNMQTETSVRKSSLSESAMQNSLSGRRTDGPIEEEPVKPCHYMTINPVTESPTVEIVAGSDGSRFPNAARVGDEMAPFQTSKPPPVIGAATALSLSCSEMTYGDESDYVPMVTPTGESYMVMAARRLDNCHGLGLEPHGSSSSVSSAMSSVGSMSVLESSDRSFHSHSLSHLQEVAAADGGYIEMTSPQNLTERSSCPLRPDIVPCYVRDEGAEEFPKRAYSVGSKPVPVANKPLNSSYIDMSGRSGAKKEAEKSSSAPHLNDDDEKKRELSDLFMELDFNRSKRDVGVKGASEFRGRASSGGSRELRMKAMSFSAKEAIQRFSLFSKKQPSAAAQHSDAARRPRTSTICQESLRPRTSSFGPSDQRPRSSSGGNACFADVMSRQLQAGGGGGELSSQDSLRRHVKRSSQEGLKSGKTDPYMNMNLGRRSTERLKMAETDAGYMDMKPGEDADEPNYMRMSAGTTSPVTTTSAETPSARTSLGVTIKQKLEAGGSEDYLAMTPGSAPQSTKVHGTASSSRPLVKVTKSSDEVNSSYMEMAPRGTSSERSAAANSERKDVHPSRKSDDNYMEMSVGGSAKHGDSLAASNRAQSVAARADTTSDRARGSVTLASSPNRGDSKGSGRELSASPKEDVVPPPPFDLSFPSQSFFLHADPAPTIPGQSPASRTEPQAATDGAASQRLSGQISYATLDLGSSVDPRPAAPLVEGRGGTGAVGRGRSFGPGSHQHVYAQIDFEKTEDCQE